MNPLIGQSLIGGAGQIGSSIINAVSANKMQQKQFEQQQSLYDKQFQQQRQMIAEQNAYNSPANQRKLLEEAGLNPMLMYQNGTSNSIQSDVARPEVAQAPLPIGAGSAIAAGIDKSLQTMMSLAQIRQLEANTKKTESETVGLDITNSKLAEKIDAEIVNLQQQTEESVSRVNLNSQQWKLFNEQITSEQVKQEQMRAETEGIRISAEEARSRIINNILEASLYSLRKTMMQSQIDLNTANMRSLEAKRFLDIWERNYREKVGLPSTNMPSLQQLPFVLYALGMSDSLPGQKRGTFENGATRNRYGDMPEGELNDETLGKFINDYMETFGNSD